MANTRVYILAKELGVKSSAIVQKCQDEDLDVKGHMSSISAGLAATIVEWFSEGEHTTTVEKTEKVNLAKVRVKRKKKKAAKPSDTAISKDSDSSDQTVDTVVATSVEAQVDSAIGDQAEPKTKPASDSGENEETQEPVEIAAQTGEPDSDIPTESETTPEVIAKPEVIVPAGPMLTKPKPAQLSGPEIVRIEKPEPIRSRRPIERNTGNQRPNRPAPTVATKAAPAGDSSKPSKSTRKKTYSPDDSKQTNISYQRRKKDIAERQARIDAAGGTRFRSRPKRGLSSRNRKIGTSASAHVRPEKATVTEPITVKDLSSALAIKVSETITALMKQGVMASANQVIMSDVAETIALDLGVELIVERKQSSEDLIAKELANLEREHLTPRSVIVTMLGHVDHGKTSLLDKIRSANVTEGEAGGITQHIGAYQITHNDKTITFLDTPGHEAFTAMRARGANMTDVVVLVIAADDGVMPQTAEAINHAKAAGVPIVIALNKSDLPGCDYNRIFSQLATHEVAPAEWGGQTELVKTSAITGMGIDDLLEHLEYIADLSELTADNTIAANGWVVESKMDPRRGVVATLLLKEGHLTTGDIVFAGSGYGRIKAMSDSSGKKIKKAISSMPVEITGLSEPPQAGDKFYCLDDINKAKNAAEDNSILSREKTMNTRSQVTLDNLFSQIEAGNVKELNLMIRADVQGSVDVLTQYLTELNTEEVKIKILQAAVGGITEGDVILAQASNAIIIGFNVIADDRAAKIAESSGVNINLYTIIYRITDDLRKSMSGLLEPEAKEQVTGKAIVREIFKVSKIGTIAGCFVTDGLIKSNAKVRLIRNNIIVNNDLILETLKRFKDNVKEVKSGFECGIKIAKYNDLKVDDVLEFCETIMIARTL